MSARPRGYSRSRWRMWVIGGYAAIVVLLAALWGWSLYAPIDEAEENEQYDKLTAIAHVGAVALEGTSASADAIVGQLSADENMRVTLIDKNGTVLADTQADPATMENHASRPEVAAAINGETGTDRRLSDTESVECLYVAVPATYNSQDVVLRVSMPLSQVQALAQNFRDTGLALLVATVALALLVAWLVFPRATKPVTRLERMRTDFVANASHELKTPVAGIRLLSESIGQASQEGDMQTVRVFAERLDKDSERLQRLVGDLLDLSRLEGASAAKPAASACDLRAVAAACCDAHASQVKAKGLSLTLADNLPSGSACEVQMTAADAALIVNNLLDNAITYTQEGSVTVKLAALGELDTQGALSAQDARGARSPQVVLIVRDTGIGIPQEEQERIFERFYRVNKDRSREAGGTGLGLSLVRHAAEMAGGSVRVQSAVGEGSEFTVTLPLAGR